MFKKPVLIPIPSTDVDPTETAVPWRILSDAGVSVVFATPHGEVGRCDPRMLYGKGLGVCSALLKADKQAWSAYGKMILSDEFRKPIKWAAARSKDFDALLLPGGHAPGMKEYLESELLQNLVLQFFAADKLVGAICHGVVLVGRSTDKEGKSVLHGRKTTALLAAQEYLAWLVTYPWLKDYYRTYQTTVEAEIKSKLATPEDFIKGPLPLRRDTPKNLSPGFTVRHGNYISARWPGDAHKFGTDFLGQLKK